MTSGSHVALEPEAGPTRSDQFHPAEEIPSSNAAVSGASEPCVAFRSIDSPKSLRSVPASAFAGSVAPIVVAPLLDGVRRLERQQDARTRRHEVGQLAEERPLAVHGVEALGFRLRQVLQPHGANGEARRLDAREDLPGEPALDGVRLDDCEVRSMFSLSSARTPRSSPHLGAHVGRALRRRGRRPSPARPSSRPRCPGRRR